MSLELLADVFAHYIVSGDEAKDRTVMRTADLPMAMQALNVYSKPQCDRLCQVLDEDGYIEFEQFVNAMTVELDAQNRSVAADGSVSATGGQSKNDIIMEAYYMFTNGEDRCITTADLKRVSSEINDNATATELSEMISLFSSAGSDSLDYKAFSSIMARSGML